MFYSSFHNAHSIYAPTTQNMAQRIALRVPCGHTVNRRVLSDWDSSTTGFRSDDHEYVNNMPSVRLCHSRLLHGPSLVAVGLSVVYGT